MAAPSLNVFQNGIAQVSGDQLNTNRFWAVTVSQLRAFIGISNMMVYVQGFTSAMDGGQGDFWWNSSASNPVDDGGITTIVPNGAANGAWLRIQKPTVDVYSYNVPLTGFTLTIPNYTNWLVLNPAGTLASGAITMPALAYDGQYVGVTSSQTVTTLTLNANVGQTIYGAPTTITATAPFRFIYKASLQAFFRVV